MKPIVLLFSEPNALSLNILENLLVNFCHVKIFSNKLKTWKKITAHIVKKEQIEYIQKEKIHNEKSCDYIIYVDLSCQDLIKAWDLLNPTVSNLKAKTLLIASYRRMAGKTDPLLKYHNVGVIYADDLFGPRMDFDGSRTSEIIKASMTGANIVIRNGEKIYPLSLNETARTISKWLFSFGPFGEETLLLSPGIFVEDFCKLIQKIRPGFKYKISDELVGGDNFGRLSVFKIDTDYAKSLETTLTWFGSNQINLKPEKVRKQKTKVKSSHKINIIFTATFLLLAGVVSPLIILFISAVPLYFAKEAASKGNLQLTGKLLDISKNVSQVSYTESGYLAKIPLVGKIYDPVVSFSYVIKNASQVGIRAIAVYEGVADLYANIFGQSTYNPGALTEKIFSNLDYIEKTIYFTEGELKLYPSIYKKIDLENAKLLLRESKNIISAIPRILAETGKKRYLVLFQNNMELRPGGGFIGSFALVSFEGGRLVDISVSDVYSADGQLRGYVEPPAPIKKYLNEPSWFLRDSNWDVDFVKNAQKAEWFLDKEIDVGVDGVIAIDLNLAKNFLNQIGPIYLKDYDIEITADNLYEKTQSEVEEDFFPGSVKKASFLTALVREILQEITSGKSSELFNIGLASYKSLTEKHVQLFFHDQAGQNSIAALGWDGSFLPNQFGLVEANLGVNKANYFLKRNYLLDVSNGVWNLKIFYENTANPAIGNRGIYKTYLRLVVPNSSSAVEAIGYELDITEASGRKENGFYFEVFPGEKKEINIIWEMPFDGIINWRKQPGTGEENVTLTIDGNIVYNTAFLQDIIWSNTY